MDGTGLEDEVGCNSLWTGVRATPGLSSELCGKSGSADETKLLSIIILNLKATG